MSIFGIFDNLPTLESEGIDNPTQEDIDRITVKRKKIIQETYELYHKQWLEYKTNAEVASKIVVRGEGICSHCGIACHCFMTFEWIVNYIEILKTVRDIPPFPEVLPPQLSEVQAYNACIVCKCKGAELK